MTTNYLLWQLVKPSHIVLILVLIGLLFWPSRFGRRCRNTGCILLVILGFLPIGNLITRPLEDRFEQPFTIDSVDGIIVLAGSEIASLSEYREELHVNEAGERLTTFLKLANRWPSARLVHSGQLRESNAVAPWLQGSGIDLDRVFFDSSSNNTCASGSNLKQKLSPAADEEWILVTTASHMPRAMACFRAVNWGVVPYPTDYRTGPDVFLFDLVGNLDKVDVAAHEWLGLLYYRVTQRTTELFPAPDLQGVPERK